MLGFAWAAFDENSQQVVLYGEGQGGVGQTWIWDGSQWHQMATPSPPARSGATMAFDPSSRQVVLFGGLGDAAFTLLNDTWAWNNSVWTKLTPGHSPPPRQDASSAPFSTHHQLLLIGGLSGDAALGDAWIWNGSDWSSTIGPGARFGAAAIDVGIGVFLFGGADSSSQRNDSLEWDGSTWAAS
jgi:hypothetical protein